MRAFGIAMLVAGFLWIGWDTAIGFVDDQHTIWVSESQHMPPGDMLTRDQASGAMRNLSLALKDRHRVLFLPALLMLVGGLTATFSRSRQKEDASMVQQAGSAEPRDDALVSRQSSRDA
jgi:hypothetical protein